MTSPVDDRGPAVPDLPDFPLFGPVTVGQAFMAAVTVLVPAIILGHLIVGWAWARGWEPYRLRNVALVIGAATAVAGPLTGTVPWWGVTNMAGAIRQAGDGHYLTAGINSAGATAPLVAAAAWVWWHLYCTQMRSGTAHVAGERHIRRQQQRREATATRRARRDHTPLTRTRRDGTTTVLLGPATDTVYPHAALLSETVLRRSAPWLEIPMAAIALHMACIAQTGAGKTTTLERLAAAWADAAWTLHNQHRGDRPLVIFLAAKGGPDAGRDARVWADTMEELGLAPNRIGVFPFETRLDMWRMPADQLHAALHKLARTEHRFYDVLQRGLLHLVLDSPHYHPPTNSAEFLQRLNRDWLAAAWAGHLSLAPCAGH